ncbi:MAG: glycerophosphodiester phosphodiesterase [Actinomycetota bacterium]
MVLVFGHGSDDPGDELNSRASFQRLANSPYDGLELDVRRTADDALVARHDPHLADGRAVRDILSVDLPDDVVMLDEVLDIMRGRIVNIEIKNYSIDPGFDADERVTDLVLDLLEARDGSDRVIVSSFGPGCLRRVRERRPELPTAVLLYYREEVAEVLDRVVRDGHPLVHPFEPHVDEVFVSAAHERGIGVNVWTMDERVATMQRLVDLGVDGIITGRPERVPLASGA